MGKKLTEAEKKQHKSIQGKFKRNCLKKNEKAKVPEAKAETNCKNAWKQHKNEYLSGKMKIQK